VRSLLAYTGPGDTLSHSILMIRRGCGRSIIKNIVKNCKKIHF
jgi:hypothetical protein